jgi:pyruvate,water dikinase
MSTQIILPLADPGASLEIAGGKGASLARLSAAGLPIPDGFHITTAAYRQFVAINNLQPQILEALKSVDPAQPGSLDAAAQVIQGLFAQASIPASITEQIEQAYALLPGVDLPVAVRSSATAEDLPELSFAGQQETLLNVHGIHALLEAVKSCWASLWTARAISYRFQHQVDQDTVALAVVVQILLPAESAGILFTANPITGQRSEIFINAAWGLGEAIVGGKVTPDTIIADKQTGKVKQVDIADKALMTVRIQHGTEEVAVPAKQRKERVLDEAGVVDLVRLANQIESLYGVPQDIEWCQAEGQFYILQSRPITALPEEPEIPEPPVPSSWKLPKGAYMAMRNNIVELMAEPLTPLFSTLGRSAINTSLNRLLAQFFGRPGTMPEEIIITVNGYAYYNGSLKGGQMLRILFGSFGIMKRMFRGAVERWTEQGRPQYFAAVESWRARPWKEMHTTELVAAAGELAEAAIDAYGCLLSGVIPAAWITEGIFTFVYNRLIKRHSDPLALTYMLGFDSTPIQAEKSLFSLAEWAGTCPTLANHIKTTPTSQLVSQLSKEQSPAGVSVTEWQEWQARFKKHLEQYGHTIYNLDFANPLPFDDPTPLLDACKMYLNGQGVNPTQRQQAAIEQREQATQAMDARLKGFRRNWFHKTLARAQRYTVLREDGLAEVGYSYPLLRQMLGEVGRRLSRAGLIDQADDIYWLNQDEVNSAAARLDRGEALASLVNLVQERKALWKAQDRATPPLSIPNLKKRRTRRKSKDVLRGVAASPGRTTGLARVLHGPADFAQMQPGEVLVASITTPAWTPLFAMASAVVTDVGGPLSHGSIVAREYGIPAVLGTGDATKRIHSGQLITVDGGLGQVQIETRAQAIPPSDGSTAIQWQPPNPKGVYMRASVVDLLPEPISPLFESMGISALFMGVEHAARILTRTEPMLHEDYFTTINSYAYMNAAMPPRTWWWAITGMLLAYPRMLRIVVPYWRDEALPQYKDYVARQQGQDLSQLSAADLWQLAQELLQAAMNYLGTLMFATMGASAGAEGLLTKVYEKVAQRAGDPPAAALLMGYNSIPMQADISLYDLAMWCQENDTLAAYVLATPSETLAVQLAGEETPAGVSREAWETLQERFDRHLMHYGHIIYELDFAKPLPVDDPAPMLETVKMYLRGAGVNPHERQQSSEALRIQTTQATLQRLKGIRRWAFQKALNWGQSMAEVRESALADIGLGYPPLRLVLGELGDRFAKAGAIPRPTDIYWLKREEVEANLAGLVQGRALDSLSGVVEKRKLDWQFMKENVPPPMIPMKKKFLGIKTDIFVAASESDQTESTLKGVATSPGKVTGPARVLHGPEDFDLMQPGDVLVAQITTPAWTPLFAMACAVVTDVGGPLSHGSIVAREYGIPAVMGTGIATRRIHNGQIITVDGSTGLVTFNGSHN